jgi:hypothetical protein
VVSGGTCKCHQGWTGSRCQYLKMGAVAASEEAFRPAYGFSPNVTSWGGNALKDDNGTWHLFVSEMSGGCGLSSWTTNCKVFFSSPVYSPRKRQCFCPTLFPDGRYLSSKTFSGVVKGMRGPLSSA